MVKKISQTKLIKLSFIFNFIFVLTVYGESIKWRLSSGEYQIIKDEKGYDIIEMKGFSHLGSPGAPQLPQKIFHFALPPDVDISSIKLDIQDQKKEFLSGYYDIKPAPPSCTWADRRFIVDWGSGKNIVDGKDMNIYGIDSFFPFYPVEIHEISQMRKWKFVSIKYTPFQYNPVSKKLLLTSSIEISISFTKTEIYKIENSKKKFFYTLNDSIMDDVAQEIFVNFEEANLWYKETLDKLKKEIGTLSTTTKYDYVIITTNTIKNNSSKLMDFVNQKILGRGYSVKIITEDDYGGLTGQAPNGTAEKIRQWLIDNYISMGIKYVLLIGNPDPINGDIPMKLCWPRNSEADCKETPTDYFYADLTGNWDLDGDGFFGEYDGDRGTGGVDMAPEVYVGRIPVYNNNYKDLDDILNKIITYEKGGGDLSWRKKMLLPVAKSDFEGTDGRDLPKRVIEDYLQPCGFSYYVLYEKAGVDPLPDTTDYDNPSHLGIANYNVLNEWVKHYGCVFWWGHGDVSSAWRLYWNFDIDNDNVPDDNEKKLVPFFTLNECNSLNNNFPSIVYQCSCLNGHPESHNNLGYELLKNGAIATISAARVSFYVQGRWNPNKNLADNVGIGYYFFEKVIKDNKPLGEAIYISKYELGPSLGKEGWINKMTFNLYGDPSLSLIFSLPPILNIQPTTLIFPRDEERMTFKINNIGGEPLVWSIGTPIYYQGSGWINSINPIRGTTTSETDTIIVTVNRTGLAPGTYNALIPITSNGGNLNLLVTMVVSPILNISKSSLDFGSSNTLDTFDITNTGIGTLIWEIMLPVYQQGSSGWITSISPNRGTTNSERDTITVTVNRTGFLPGTYTAIIPINSNGGNADVRVYMTVLGAVLNITPNSLDFGNANSSMTFSIRNNGNIPLNWNIGTPIYNQGNSWITSIDPLSGSTTSETDIVTVTIDRNNLAPGTYTAVIPISSNGGNQNLHVSMTVIKPILKVEPIYLNFKDTDTSKNIYIRNIGNGTLTWNILGPVYDRGNNWITSISPLYGRTTTETDIVTITIDKTGLAPGKYTASIMVHSNDVDQIVSISLIIGPFLNIEPVSLDFGTADISRTFNITNIGTGTLEWEVEQVKYYQGSNWIKSIDPLSGSTTSETDIVTVTIDRNNLAPGTYTAQISIYSNGDAGKVLISMTVGPILNIKPLLLDFAETETSLNFDIINEGTETLNWTIGPPIYDVGRGWITKIIPESGSTTQTNTVTIVINRTGLPPGKYSAKIPINSNGGNKNIEIYMIVAKPDLKVDPISLNFGDTNNSLSFKILNLGVGTLNWTIGTPIYNQGNNWITSIDPLSGSTTSETDIVTVTIDRNNLAPGTYTAVIPITSNVGNQNLYIYMTVGQPSLIVRPLLLNFGPTDNEMTFNIINGGVGTLQWNIGSPIYYQGNNWITSITPVSGSTMGSDIISIAIDRTGVEPGIYSAIIPINSNGGNQDIYVIMEAFNTSVSGTIFYNGKKTGTVHICLFNSPGQNDSPIYKTEIQSLGTYSISGIQPMQYYISAFMDTDGNGKFDEEIDPMGIYHANPIIIQAGENKTDINIVLADKGDLDGNGETDISDVILCLRLSIGLDVSIGGNVYSFPYPDWLIYRSDMNLDKTVDILDVILNLRKVIGL